MSEENKNIDQLFSDAAHTEKAPQYDSAYWAEMNEMLNARDAKKRRFFLWAFGGSAAFAVLLFSLFTLNMDKTQNQKRYVQEGVNIKVENTTVKVNNNTAFKTKTMTPKETVIHDGNDFDAAQSKNINTAKSQNKPLHYNKEKNQEREKSTIAEKETSKNNSSTENKLLTSKHTNRGVSSVFDEDNADNVLKDERKIRNGKGENNHTSKQETVNPSSKNQGNTNLSATLPYRARYNLSQKEAGTIVESGIAYTPKPRYNFYTKISGGLMENYKTSRPYESGLIDLSLNVEADFNAVLIRTGIGSQLTTNADLIVSQRAKVYGFGVTNHQNDLSYQNLFDIYIPLEIGYRYKNTSFGVGAQANYLVTSSMDLNHYENNFLVNTDQYFGNTNGLNPFSTQGYLWIEQRFTPLISCGLKVGTNISGRIEDDAYFNNSATTNPIYGQLSLRINFTK